jgi:hypothetical protein
VNDRSSGQFLHDWLDLPRQFIDRCGRIAPAITARTCTLIHSLGPEGSCLIGMQIVRVSDVLIIVWISFFEHCPQANAIYGTWIISEVQQQPEFKARIGDGEIYRFPALHDGADDHPCHRHTRPSHRQDCHLAPVEHACWLDLLEFSPLSRLKAAPLDLLPTPQKLADFYSPFSMLESIPVL